MCSETSEAVGTTWEHAQLEFQKFLKIRIPLLEDLKIQNTLVGLLLNSFRLHVQVVHRNVERSDEIFLRS